MVFEKKAFNISRSIRPIYTASCPYLYRLE